MIYRCPVCKEILRGEERKSQFFPFCSQRCRLIDLGKWLDAKYVFVSKPEDNTGSNEKDE